MIIGHQQHFALIKREINNTFINLYYMAPSCLQPICMCRITSIYVLIMLTLRRLEILHALQQDICTIRSRLASPSQVHSSREDYRV